MARPDDPEPVNVTPLDTAQATIGVGLRTLFEPVLQADVPPNLTSLAETLENRLDEAAGRDEPPEETAAETQPSASSSDA